MTKLVLRFTPKFMVRRRFADNSLKQRRSIEDVQGLARESLAAATGALDAAGVEAWLTWGSVLGFLREGGFISHDNDIDFAIPLGSMTPRLISELEARGLKLFGVTTHYGQGYNYKFLNRGFGVDFYGMQDCGSEYLSRSRYRDSCCVYAHPKLPRVRRKFEGSEVWVLDPVESYVRQIYGEGWVRPPAPGWHNSFSLLNLRAIEVTPLHLPQLAAILLKWKLSGLSGKMDQGELVAE